MRVLLLGATGFVGTNLLRSLACEAIEILAVTRGEPRQPTKHVRWVSYGMLEQRQPDFDAVVCTAGVGNPASFETEPLRSAERDIAEQASRLAVRARAKMIYLSSGGAVYGEGWDGTRGVPFDESVPCRPVSSYGKAKLEAESLLLQRLQRDSEHTIVLRASNVYGLDYAKLGRQGLVNALIDRALQRKPITIYGDGLVFRDYLYSDDLARAIRAALFSSVTGCFNIGSGRSHSILDVVGAVEAAAGYRFERHNTVARSFDVKFSALTITKAREELGWVPVVELESGIAMIWKHRGRS